MYIPSIRIRFKEGRTSKKLVGKVIFLLYDANKLCNLIQQFINFFKVIGKFISFTLSSPNVLRHLSFNNCLIWSNPIFCSKFWGYIMDYLIYLYNSFN